MKDDDARVPTLLLCGGSHDDRDAAITQLSQPVAGGRQIFVLRAGAGMFSSPARPLGPHVVIRRAPIGCLCCTARVVFRTALLGLLHTGRPERLVVDLGWGDHVAALEAELESASLARVLRLIGRVELDASRAIRAMTWPADAHPQ